MGKEKAVNEDALVSANVGRTLPSIRSEYVKEVDADTMEVSIYADGLDKAPAVMTVKKSNVYHSHGNGHAVIVVEDRKAPIELTIKANDGSSEKVTSSYTDVRNAIMRMKRNYRK